MKSSLKIFSGCFFLKKIAAVLILFISFSETFGQFPQKPFSNSSFCNVSGISLHYRNWPVKESCRGNVILVHGFSGSTFSWRKTADSLSDSGYNVIAVDIPPYGYSDKSPRINQSNTFRASLIKDFLEQNFPDKKWIIIGHSMGGGIAQSFALMYPAMTEKAVLVDGLLFLKNDTSSSPFSVFSIPPLQKFLASFGEEYLITGSNIEKFLRSAYARDPDKNEITGYLNPLQIDGTARAILASTDSRNIAVLDASSMIVPCLCIWGDKDTWVPKWTADKVLKAMPKVKVAEIPGAGHCPMETHHREFLKVLLEFLNE